MDSGHEFVERDYAAPLDIAAVLARVPADATLRAFYPRAIIEHARRIGRPLPVERFFFEKDTCSLRDVVELLPLAASVLHPDVPVREGLRRIGRLSHEAMLSSPVGRVLFGVVRKHVPSYLKMVPMGVRRSGSHARAGVEIVDKRTAVVSLDEYRSYVEGAIGAIEAALEDAGVSPTVKVRTRAVDAFDLLITWTR